jgi:GNAT superfamily N-acetyltransferase
MACKEQAMTVQLRPFTEHDYEAFVATLSAIYPEYPESVADHRHWDATRDKRCYMYRVLAEQDGLVIGFGQYNNVAYMFDPQKFWLDLGVHPEYRGQGIEAHIYNHLIDHVTPREPSLFWANCREDWAYRMSFLAERGFVEKMRYWESRLDVASFDPNRFAGASERVADQGIVIKTLRELEGDPQRDQKLYQLIKTVVQDVPSPDGHTEVAFDVWLKGLQGNPNLLPDAYFIALDGERYVGLSNLWRMEGVKDLSTGLTGVLREDRRLGIALALKLRAVDYAKRVGAPQIRTGNEQNNRAMLSINEAFGFAKMPPWIDFVKQIG